VQLRKLKTAIIPYQDKIELALWDAVHKSPEEAYVTEISIVLSEIEHHIQH
jgi:aldehyde dehydrogenase (NAD+)